MGGDKVVRPRFGPGRTLRPFPGKQMKSWVPHFGRIVRILPNHPERVRGTRGRPAVVLGVPRVFLCRKVWSARIEPIRSAGGEGATARRLSLHLRLTAEVVAPDSAWRPAIQLLELAQVICKRGNRGPGVRGQRSGGQERTFYSQRRRLRSVSFALRGTRLRRRGLGSVS